jgi:uncharacterized protein
MGTMLDQFEIRVLAVLAEKEILTPDVYPMSLNSLTNGCNQVSSRNPVMSISEATVQEVLDRLIQSKLVAEVKQAGARVVKYEHRLRIKWLLEQDKLAILVILMLRGWQTAGEIRARTGRLHEFASVHEVEQGLQFLIDKYPPLVARLALAPGSKEPRYAQLLAGEESLALQEVAVAYGADPHNVPSNRPASALEQEVAQLREELSLLKQQFESFKRQFE